MLSSYVGEYEFANGPSEIKLSGGHLVVGGIVLFAESETKFFDKTWGIQLEFTKNDKGGVASVTWRQDGKEESGKKR